MLASGKSQKLKVQNYLDNLLTEQQNKVEKAFPRDINPLTSKINETSKSEFRPTSQI
jgi:hypothetical protein